jgi:hypothetical protein
MQLKLVQTIEEKLTNNQVNLPDEKSIIPRQVA